MSSPCTCSNGGGTCDCPQTFTLRAESAPVFHLVRLQSMGQIRANIRECEGKHAQQVVYSTYHDALTQVCFGCCMIRTNMAVG